MLGTPVIPEPGTVSGMGAGSRSGVSTGLPAGISLTGNGGLDVAGLEWLGARAYDPAARGFLSTDPLPPVLGAGWDGNPYAYAGNNPLNATDPAGLRPLTDEDLKAYDASNRGAFAAVGDWMSDNWEYVVGGAAIVGGAALLFVPGGQLVGAGLISFGADVVIQKATTGEVNWVQAGVSGGLGMLGFGAASAVGKSVAAGLGRAAVNQMGKAAVTNGGIGGAINTGMYFMTKPKEDWSPRGAGAAMAGGVVTGVISPQASYLSAPLLGFANTVVRYGVAGGGAVLGGGLEKLIAGEKYTVADVGFDLAGGMVLSHFPGAAALSPRALPGWLDHSVAAYGGGHASIISGSLEFVFGKAVLGR